MYWIKTVSEMTGIPKNTLIAWERRYGLLKPERSPSGYRVYSAEDLEVLERVKELMKAGYRISQAAEMVQRAPPGRQGTQPEIAPEGLDGLRGALLVALLDFDRHAADRLVRTVVTLPYEAQLDELYLPVLQETGHRWEAGEVTTVQEHFVSAWCREQILVMARSLESGGPRAPLAICATPAGEHHEFGLLGAAFRLANRGYRLVYLGADVPTDQLLDLIRARKPALVAISVVIEREGFDLPLYAEQLLEALEPDGRLLVGGRASQKWRAKSSGRVSYGAGLEAADAVGTPFGR
ncbi:MAG: MerR family transcriptional regulator [Proteobacteria bacterium]|nr:MerR family transcriptional regulator [Pseudomonadota bacterium]